MGLQEALHTHWPILSLQQVEGFCYLPCKTEKTKVQRDRILSSLFFLPVMYCFPGENYSLMTKLSKSPQSIYVSYNSQSPTISQKVLQGDSNLWKDVLIFYSKITSVRHLLIKFMFIMNLGIYIGISPALNKHFVLLFSELCDYQLIKLWKLRKSESRNLYQ